MYPECKRARVTASVRFRVAMPFAVQMLLNRASLEDGQKSMGWRKDICQLRSNWFEVLAKTKDGLRFESMRFLSKATCAGKIRQLLYSINAFVTPNGKPESTTSEGLTKAKQ